MNGDLQFWTNVGLAIIAIVVALLAWLKPNARFSLKWLPVLRRFLPYVLVATVFLLIGYRLGARIGTPQQNSRSLILNPIIHYSYDFENIQKVPLGITATGHVKNIDLAGDIYLPNGQQSLAVDLELPAWASSSDRGGITVSLEKSQRVDGISMGVLIPEASNTREGGFQAYFAALNTKDEIFFSGSQPVPVGQWSFQFWGTRYAHSDDMLCPDIDLNDQCDEPADSYWYSWTDNSIEEFSILITRDGKAYDGIIYIDDIKTYLVK